MDNNYLVGRQPILDKQEEVVAYELLFRSPESLSSAGIVDATMASANVIVNTLSNFGIVDMLGGQRGFINVEADLLMSDVLDILPTEMIGLELVENIILTPDVVDRCRELKARGCLLALDDHEYRPEYEVLYDGLIDVVKFDVINTPVDHLYEMAGRLKKYPVKMLAEKVDSRAVYLRSKGMGFELFQGYFFARPSLMQKRKLEDSAGFLFDLLGKLGNDASVDVIEETFKKSPAMTYKLLLLVNSVSTGLREKIRTVRHAITIVGLGQLKKWVQLAVFAADDSRGLNNPCVEMAAVRAGMMEGLSLRHPMLRSLRGASEQAFMVGVLSILKDFYEIPMQEMVSGLNLSDEICTALVNKQGALGDLLRLAELLEQMKLSDVAELAEMVGVGFPDIVSCQKKAFMWRESFA
jgi:c-di-GMP-related signal transduction protein